jgi:1-acyl-sn-glycerol-3-phosphate acyltransferase
MTEEAKSSAAGRDLITWSTPVFRAGRFACKVELKLLHRLSVHGRENVPTEGGVLLVCNHQSFLDIPIVAASLKRHVCFVARESLARSRFLAFLMHHSGAVLIKRGVADRQALQDMVGHLRAGDCVAVYPEGTRSRDGSLGEFRAGALFAAKRARVPIVPAGIRGAFEALPRDAKLPRPRRVALSYAPPIDGRDPEAMDRAREAIAAMIGDGRYGTMSGSPPVDEGPTGPSDPGTRS